MTTNNAINVTPEQLQAMIAQGVAAALGQVTPPTAQAPVVEATPTLGEQVKHYARQAAFVGTDTVALTGTGTRAGLHWVADIIKTTGDILEQGAHWVANMGDDALGRTEEEYDTFLNKTLQKYNIEIPAHLK